MFKMINSLFLQSQVVVFSGVSEWEVLVHGIVATCLLIPSSHLHNLSKLFSWLDLNR